MLFLCFCFLPTTEASQPAGREGAADGGEDRQYIQATPVLGGLEVDPNYKTLI